jgi:hypothetical protein
MQRRFVNGPVEKPDLAESSKRSNVEDRKKCAVIAATRATRGQSGNFSPAPPLPRTFLSQALGEMVAAKSPLIMDDDGHQSISLKSALVRRTALIKPAQQFVSRGAFAPRKDSFLARCPRAAVHLLFIDSSLQLFA